MKKYIKTFYFDMIVMFYVFWTLPLNFLFEYSFLILGIYEP